MNLLLGLGGNIGDPEGAFRKALLSLGRMHRVLAVSRLYRTRPVGPEQPVFLNLAATIELRGPLPTLLADCHCLEEESGRDRSCEQRWGPRALDLDLLLADSVVCRGPKLVLPHPRMHERVFTLAPAAEVAPEWMHPLLGSTVAALLESASREQPDAIVGVESFEL